MISVRNARFVDADLIDCEIEHPEYGWIPFLANPNDTEKHGRDIFNALKDHEITKPLDLEELKSRKTEESRHLRDSLLLELDSVITNKFRIKKYDEKVLENYRQDLLDVPQQLDFPFNITWPKSPL